MERLTPDRTIDLAITGMTCASCVSRVEKVLGRVPGGPSRRRQPRDRARPDRAATPTFPP